jgi:hypothetical protein
LRYSCILAFRGSKASVRERNSITKSGQMGGFFSGYSLVKASHLSKEWKLNNLSIWFVGEPLREQAGSLRYFIKFSPIPTRHLARTP